MSKLLPNDTPTLLSRLAEWLNMVKVEANNFFLLIHLNTQASHLKYNPFICLPFRNISHYSSHLKIKSKH